MSDNLQVIQDLTLRNLEQRSINLPNKETAEMLIIPDDCKVVPLEKHQSAPSRISDSRTFESVESFCSYTEKFSDDSTTITIPPSQFYNILSGENAIVGAISYIDDNGVNQPSWGEHKANLRLFVTKEFTRWMQKNQESFGQLKFAQFLSDNVENIVAPDLAAVLLAVKKYRVKETSEVVTEAESFSEESNVHHKLIGDELPEFLTLTLKPLRFFRAYELKARLVVSINQNNRPEFSYSLINVDLIIDHMIKQITEDIKEATGIQPYL